MVIITTKGNPRIIGQEANGEIVWLDWYRAGGKWEGQETAEEEHEPAEM